MPGTEEEIREVVSVREDAAERERKEMRAEVVAVNRRVEESTVRARKDAQMVEEAVQLVASEIKLLKIRRAARDVEDELRTAAEDLISSYPGEPGLPRFWAWNVPMLEEKLRILHHEQDLLAGGMRNESNVRQ